MTTQATTEAPPREHLAILEAILFSSTRPQPMDALRTLTGWQSKYIEQAMNVLVDEYADRGIQIRMVANGWQMVTSPSVASVVEKMHAAASKSALSRAAMETLAIIAYRQPVTRAQIESLRGVKVDHIIPQLFEKNFIRELGRAQAPGRPMLLGTTRHFLTHFGLKNLDDLPELPPDETLSDVKIQHRVADALDAAEHQAAEHQAAEPAAEQLSFGD